MDSLSICDLLAGSLGKLIAFTIQNRQSVHNTVYSSFPVAIRKVINQVRQTSSIAG